MQRNDNFLINLNSHFRKSSLEFTVFGSTYYLLFLLHRNVLLFGIKIRIRIILIEIEFVVHVLPFNFLVEFQFWSLKRLLDYNGILGILKLHLTVLELRLYMKTVRNYREVQKESTKLFGDNIALFQWKVKIL